MISRDGEGFIVVYSVTSRSTYDRVERIVERILRVKEETSPAFSTSTSPSTSGPSQKRIRIPIVIVGNKRDKYQERQVSTEEAKMLASQLGCEFHETSAKNGTNVEAAFKSLVRLIKASKSPQGAGHVGNGLGGGGIAGGGRKKKKKCVVL